MLREPLKQICGSSDVLAHLGEAWGDGVIFNDPPLHVAGHGLCARWLPMAGELLFKLIAHELECQPRIFELLQSCLYLLHAKMGWVLRIEF